MCNLCSHKCNYCNAFITLSGIADESKPFGGILLGSAIKTFVMFAGEYDFSNMRFSSSKVKTNDGTGSITDVETLNYRANPPKLTFNHKAEVILGQLIFAAFVFMFPVVVMNLLNAFAIGDIQVKIFSGLQRISLQISSPCV